MRKSILIVGQGLAGTLLAWEFERVGLPFEIVDEGHARAASRVAAGIINPITGQRFVKSWRVEQLLPLAKATYRAIENELGIALWHDLRVRRLFVDDRERELLNRRQARGLVEGYIGNTDAEGCWIKEAARVDLQALLAASRRRWLDGGQLREEHADVTRRDGKYALLIDCRGAQATMAAAPDHGDGNGMRSVPWRVSKGECLDVAVDGLDPDVVINRGHWLLPLAPGSAKFGATHEPGNHDLSTSAAARRLLETSLVAIAGRPFKVINQEAGIRVYLDDKRPLIGRHPDDARVGVFNALGAKGALVAPYLARQWTEHLLSGKPFEADVSVARCWL